MGVGLLCFCVNLEEGFWMARATMVVENTRTTSTIHSKQNTLLEGHSSTTSSIYNDLVPSNAVRRIIFHALVSVLLRFHHAS
jgi:hypothetical protein